MKGTKFKKHDRVEHVHKCGTGIEIGTVESVHTEGGKAGNTTITVIFNGGNKSSGSPELFKHSNVSPPFDPPSRISAISDKPSTEEDIKEVKCGNCGGAVLVNNPNGLDNAPFSYETVGGEFEDTMMVNGFCQKCGEDELCVLVSTDGVVNNPEAWASLLKAEPGYEPLITHGGLTTGPQSKEIV